MTPEVQRRGVQSEVDLIWNEMKILSRRSVIREERNRKTPSIPATKLYDILRQSPGTVNLQPVAASASLILVVYYIIVCAIIFKCFKLCMWSKRGLLITDFII